MAVRGDLHSSASAAWAGPSRAALSFSWETEVPSAAVGTETASASSDESIKPPFTLQSSMLDLETRGCFPLRCQSH